MNPFRFLQQMTDDVLCLAATDDVVLKMVRPVLESAMLPGDYPPLILEAIYAYFDSAKEAPGERFLAEIDFAIQSGLIREDLAPGVLRYVEALDLANANRINQDHVLKRLDEFVKQRTYSAAAVEFAQLVRLRDFDRAERLLRDALRGGIPETDYTNFFDDESILRRVLRRNQDAKFLMPTLIAPLDRRGLIFQRKFYVLIMGPEKRGKSWAGIHFGKVALLYGLNVLHMSQGDLSHEALEERYDMSFAAAGGSHIRDTNWEIESPFLELYDSQRGLWVPAAKTPKVTGQLDHERYTDTRVSTAVLYPGTVRDKDRVQRGADAMSRWGGRLYIKAWPRGVCSVEGMDVFIDKLELLEGFVPDVIINDYPDIMGMPKGMEYRHQLDYVHQYHARISHERNCLVIGFSQVKTKAFHKKYITLADFAEDKRKAAHVDLAFALCQTAEEEDSEQMRFVTVVDRHYGLARAQAVLVQDRRIGQFCKHAFHLQDVETGDESADESPEESAQTVPRPGGVD